jgi:hypothetical protein
MNEKLKEALKHIDKARGLIGEALFLGIKNPEERSVRRRVRILSDRLGDVGAELLGEIV